MRRRVLYGGAEALISLPLFAEYEAVLGRPETQRRCPSIAMEQTQPLDTFLSRMRTLDYSRFSEVDLVVEAVAENLQIKKRVLGEVENQVEPGAVIASNTSSLSIEELSIGLKRPENFARMNVFNPVPVMPLVLGVRCKKRMESYLQDLDRTQSPFAATRENSIEGCEGASIAGC